MRFAKGRITGPTNDVQENTQKTTLERRTESIVFFCGVEPLQLCDKLNEYKNIEYFWIENYRKLKKREEKT